MPFSVRIDEMKPNQFQQLLFMEDYNVFLRSLFLCKPPEKTILEAGPLWEMCAFSPEELEKAKIILESSNPFRQDAPLPPANLVDPLIPAISCIALNEKQPEQNPKKKEKNKKTPVYNKR